MVEKIGQTETETWAKEMLTCRQIVSEITKFGVSQKQLLNIIKLLSMELENRDALLAINAVVSEALDEVPGSNNLITME